MLNSSLLLTRMDFSSSFNADFELRRRKEAALFQHKYPAAQLGQEWEQLCLSAQQDLGQAAPSGSQAAVLWGSCSTTVSNQASPTLCWVQGTAGSPARHKAQQWCSESWAGAQKCQLLVLAGGAHPLRHIRLPTEHLPRISCVPGLP